MDAYEGDDRPFSGSAVADRGAAATDYSNGQPSMEGWEELVDHYLPIMWMVLGRQGLERQTAIDVCEVVWLRFAARRASANGLPVVAWLIREMNLEVATAAAYNRYRSVFAHGVRTAETTAAPVRIVRLVD